VDYVLCPLLFAFRHIYNVHLDERPTIGALWAEALGEVFVWMHLQLHDKPVLRWTDVLSHWQTKWAKLLEKHGHEPATGFSGYQRGCRHLLEVFADLPENLQVLKIKYPCSQKVAGYELGGYIDVVRATEIPGKGRSAREIQLITVDPQGARKPSPFEASRRIDYLLAKYGLEADLRRSFHRAAKEVTAWVYLPRLPVMAQLVVNEKGLRQALQWVEYVIQAIEQALYYPRMGTYCQSCQYATVCDVTYVSSRALDQPEQTSDEIRRRLNGTQGTPEP
jgi:hypothetical protein